MGRYFGGRRYRALAGRKFFYLGDSASQLFYVYLYPLWQEVIWGVQLQSVSRGEPGYVLRSDLIRVSTGRWTWTHLLKEMRDRKQPKKLPRAPEEEARKDCSRKMATEQRRGDEDEQWNYMLMWQMSVSEEEEGERSWTTRQCFEPAD